MSEDLSKMFTTEQVLEQAKGNVTGIYLGTIAYLKEQHLSPLDWTVGLGKRFAPGWEGLKGRGAREAAQMFALNCISLGGTLTSFDGDESRAEFVIKGWPGAGWLQYHQITQADADVMWEAFTPIAAFLDLRHHWQREGDSVRITFSS
jgi:hypothetical protein